MYKRQDKELNTEIVDNSDELKREIAGVQGQIDDFTSQIEIHAEKRLNTKSEATANQIVRDAQRHGELETVLAELQTEYDGQVLKEV